MKIAKNQSRKTEGKKENEALDDEKSLRLLGLLDADKRQLRRSLDARDKAVAVEQVHKRLAEQEARLLQEASIGSLIST
jgi:hypothetical protein